MDTTKQARLDNWAMFVMSRLQVFFNTTDYCDLTLQFEGNVQLKVHRVIMNACTEYFRLLEQECDMDGDVLIMPPDLQADVILPIVNFMYTGVLEYQHSIFERLYQTAELMNMTVLLKFLDAQRTKVKISRTHHQLQQPKRMIKSEKTSLPLLGRKLPIWKRKNAPVPVQINPVKPYSPETRTSISSDNSRFDNAPKPTRFEWPDDDMHDIKPFDLMPLDSSFDSISYSSKPLLTQEEEMRSTSNSTVFDDLRQLPGGKITKKTAEPKEKEAYNSNSSVDMEDLKSYVKEQKIRSGLADYEEEDDPDDPDYVVESVDRKRKTVLSPVTAKKAKVSSEKENIVEVRASSTKVDHSKIISEVFKKYPHLVQKNKNIRLKILAKKGEDKPVEKEKPKIKTFATAANIQTKKIIKPLSSQTDAESSKKNRAAEQTWECTTCTNNGEPVEFVLYYLYRKHMTDAHHKQFDARECKHCGEMYELPMQMTYHMYMAHAVVPPRSVNFPKCTRCSYVAFDKDIMSKHLNFHSMHIHHAQCANCKLGFTNGQTLKAHMQLAGHNSKNSLSFDCQYCTRQLNSAAALFVHCKTTHVDDAKRDGMLSLDDEHLKTELEETEKPAEKLSTEQIEDGNIDTSLGPFDIVVLDDQQQFILQSGQETSTEISNQQNYMTLPTLQDQTYNIGQTDIGSTDELVMVLTDHDYNDGNDDVNNDNSNIVVLYSHPVDGQQNQYITSQGNIMLNSETGMLEIHNDGLPISTQGESIEMIQKEIQSHSLAAISNVTTTTEAQKVTTESATMRVQPEHQILEDKDVSEDNSDKKVIAVEEEGTGKLINTIEEIEPDTTDFGAQHIPDVNQPEPEPMDIDDDTKPTSILETPQEIITQEQLPGVDECSELITRTTESSQETTPAQPEESSKEKIILTEEIIEKEEIPTVAEDVPTSSLTSIQPPAETEVPQDLLEPTEISANETNKTTQEQLAVSSDVDLSLEISADSANELLQQSTQNDDDEYTTSASLSVSEHCPDEPMEVDGLVSSETTTPKVDKVLKTDEKEVEETVPATTEADIGLTEINGEEGKGVEKNVETSEDVVDGLEKDDNHEDTTLVEDIPKPTDVLDALPNLPKEDSSKEVEQEAAEGTDVLIEGKSTLSTVSTVDEIGSIPESIEEPPIDDDIETAHPAQVLPQDPTTTDELSLKTLDTPTTKEIKDKTAGISTLLNDWEDTDSQTSEQGKGTTVNKLINDWDDE
ncbi:centrosome-associated zinc finger protein Cp190 [Atheta coriaria]|uniref:centrosome-associated zinc finger protein Cp190 n=1 Tax=Dalotia coriaria TaxID=877792 RepID=UPI0031F363C4